ncbi:MAG TPA: fructosamine kinase family protein, partial [Enhygromyxa sp.]|nr:fructosamine kinase family protein [Enhygromyxa sp.]
MRTVDRSGDAGRSRSASLHRSGAGLQFGLERDNYIGSVPQVNEARPDWPSFYRDCRLAPMLARAGTLIS